jgi:hypothetical protein
MTPFIYDMRFIIIILLCFIFTILNIVRSSFPRVWREDLATISICMQLTPVRGVGRVMCHRDRSDTFLY